MRDKRPLWISLLAVVIVAVVALTATLAAGWAPKLGLDLAGAHSDNHPGRDGGGCHVVGVAIGLR